jgi:GNAT superfamily N-acetyltransferase
MTIALRRANLTDVPVLARLNKQLVADEGSRNPMAMPQLEARMTGWLSGGTYTAVLIYWRGEVAGYCLYQQRQDTHFPEQVVLYVRQFCIERSLRRQGIGRTAFERLSAVCFPDDATLELEVLAHNMAGRAFWASLGFAPVCLTVQRAPAVGRQGQR